MGTCLHYEYMSKFQVELEDQIPYGPAKFLTYVGKWRKEVKCGHRGRPGPWAYNSNISNAFTVLPNIYILEHVQ